MESCLEYNRNAECNDTTHQWKAKKKKSTSDWENRDCFGHVTDVTVSTTLWYLNRCLLRSWSDGKSFSLYIPYYWSFFPLILKPCCNTLYCWNGFLWCCSSDVCSLLISLVAYILIPQHLFCAWDVLCNFCSSGQCWLQLIKPALLNVIIWISHLLQQSVVQHFVGCFYYISSSLHRIFLLCLQYICFHYYFKMFVLLLVHAKVKWIPINQAFYQARIIRSYREKHNIILQVFLLSLLSWWGNNDHWQTANEEVENFTLLCCHAPEWKLSL